MFLDTINVTQPMEVDTIHGQSMIAQFSELPLDIVRIIFTDRKKDLPAIALVCKSWKAIVDDKEFRKAIRPAQAFGTQEWKEYAGVDVGEEPCQPRRAYGDLENEGGMLTFIPEKVKVTKQNGLIEEVLLDNLKVIHQLVENPKKGNKTGFTSSITTMPTIINLKKNHWVWINKEVIGRYTGHFEQQYLIAEENKKIPGAKRPDLIDTAISVLMEYVRSGIRNFVWDPPINNQRTFIRVNPTLALIGLGVGLGFTPSGLNVFFEADGRSSEFATVVPAWTSFDH